MSEQSAALGEQSLVAGEPVLYRESRTLLGWLNDAEGIGALLGRGPNPHDDLQPTLETLRFYQAAVRNLPSYTPEDPVVAEAFRGLDDVKNRPELHAHFANMNWRPAIVDLTKVLSFQKVGHTDGIESRLKGVREKARLLEVCIPIQQPQPPRGAISDSDGKGFTISSFNPNLRIAGGQIAGAELAPGPGLPDVKMQAVTLFVYLGSSYLQVVRYRDRSFIRDGYHRAVGLLRRRITKVPCIFIDARTFEEVGTPPGSFTFEVLYGDKPPRLVDFWNDAVACTIKQVATRKVVRIRGEEFVVQR